MTCGTPATLAGAMRRCCRAVATRAVEWSDHVKRAGTQRHVPGQVTLFVAVSDVDLAGADRQRAGSD